MPTLKLTKPLIDDLKPQATDRVYWDQGLRGFGLKVTPAGHKVFIVMYRTIDGHRLRKYTLGPYGVMTLISARSAAQKILLARLDGQDPAAEKQTRRRRPVGLEIGAAIQQYKLEYLEPREIGLETVRILDRIVLTQWKGRQISGISRADIRDCIETIMRRGALSMAGRTLTVIRAFFNWCVGRGLVEASPCTGLIPLHRAAPATGFCRTMNWLPCSEQACHCPTRTVRSSCFWLSPANCGARWPTCVGRNSTSTRASGPSRPAAPRRGAAMSFT